MPRAAEKRRPPFVGVDELSGVRDCGQSREGRVAARSSLRVRGAISLSDRQFCRSRHRRLTASRPRENPRNAQKFAIRHAQAGFEPATLRLTASFFKTAWDHSRRKEPFLLGHSWSGGNPRPPDPAPSCPDFVPVIFPILSHSSDPASTRRVGAIRLKPPHLIGGVYV